VCVCVSVCVETMGEGKRVHYRVGDDSVYNLYIAHAAAGEQRTGKHPPDKGEVNCAKEGVEGGELKEGEVRTIIKTKTEGLQRAGLWL
jgi:hypothetical protein